MGKSGPHTRTHCVYKTSYMNRLYSLIQYCVLYSTERTVVLAIMCSPAQDDTKERGTEFADAELYEAFVCCLLVRCAGPTRCPVDARHVSHLQYISAATVGRAHSFASNVLSCPVLPSICPALYCTSTYGGTDDSSCAPPVQCIPELSSAVSHRMHVRCVFRHDGARRRLARWLLEHLERCNAAFLSHVSRDSGASVLSFHFYFYSARSGPTPHTVCTVVVTSWWPVLVCYSA